MKWTMAMLGAGAIGVTAVCGTVWTQAPASAAAVDDGHCVGQLVDSRPFHVGRTLIGQLNLKHNQQTGVSCAIMWHKGVTYGARLNTGVTLFLGPAATGPNRQVRYQRGPQRYQAGPVRVYDRKECVTGGGGITYQGTHYYGYTAAHCFKPPVDYE